METLRGIKYSVGYNDLKEMSNNLSKHLKVDYTYVRVHQKYNFLVEKLGELPMAQVELMNAEHQEEPAFHDDLSSRLDHRPGTDKRTQNNVNFFYNNLMLDYNKNNF